MRVSPIVENYQPIKNRKVANREITAEQTNSVNQANTVPTSNVVTISFGKDSGKNIFQVFDITAEFRAVSSLFAGGGVGTVVDEWFKNAATMPVEVGIAPENMEMRAALPYHSAENSEGNIRVAILEKDKNGNWKNTCDKGKIYSAAPDESLDDVKKRNNLNLNENQKLAFVIQEPPNDKGISKVVPLKDIKVTGEIEIPSYASIFETQKEKYRVFEVEMPDPVDVAVENKKKKLRKEIELIEKDKTQDQIQKIYEEKLKSAEFQKELEKITGAGKRKQNKVYIVHLPQLAKFNKAYGTNAYSEAMFNINNQQISSDVYYRNFCSAVVDMLPKLNTEEQGFFNPANIKTNDRQAAYFYNEIANLASAGNSYWDGLLPNNQIRAVHVYHNAGADYQGKTSDPFQFFRQIATKADIEHLNEHPEIERLKNLERNWPNVSDEDRKFLRDVFDPYFANFMDEGKSYNTSMIPLANIKINGGENFSYMHVCEYTYDEVRNLPDMSPGLTGIFKTIAGRGAKNGLTPSNMHFDDAKAGFCRGNLINGLTTLNNNAHWFTPFAYNPETKNIDEVYNAHQNNKKELLNALSKAYETGEGRGLTDMFFVQSQINDKAWVYGHLSEFKEGDFLMYSFARPNYQKGMPTTFKSFLEILKSDKLTVEQKSHMKLLVGGGVWNKDDRDYKLIQQYLHEIEQLDNGKYKGNVCFVDGFISNRFLGCADLFVPTARFEPDGVTIPEAMTAGTPSASINTGGAHDCIKHGENGYLTKNPYMMTPEQMGMDINALSKMSEADRLTAIDNKRMEILSKQMSEIMIQAFNDFQDKGKYKKIMQSCLEQQMDWHNNGKFNPRAGKSTLSVILNDIFGVEKGMGARKGQKLNRLVGDFGLMDKAKGNKFWKIFIPIVAVTGAGLATYFGIKHSKKKIDDGIKEANESKVADNSNDKKTQKPVIKKTKTKETAYTTEGGNLIDKISNNNTDSNIVTAVKVESVNKSKISGNLISAHRQSGNETGKKLDIVATDDNIADISDFEKFKTPALYNA